MTIFKKILSMMLIMMMCISLFTNSSLAETPKIDINKMATALNKLNILQGTNGDFLLNNKIDRTQAAALIIRMLGKENFVKQNTEQLKNTKFADVSSKEWYAPYVGYCTQFNIMGGYPDGRYAPKDYVSEKSFLKMVLCALGYEYNKDFDWSNVYQKAFSLGIVTDQSYAAKTLDNSNYLRSDAVKVLFSSLNTLKKGTQTKMVFTLADEGVFTREFISASGILGTDKPTEIDLVSATGVNSIEINLNKSINSVNAADIAIFDALTTSSALTVQSVAFTNDKIQVITAAGQIPGRTYSVKINSVTDVNGNISGQLVSSFQGYTPPQVSSDYFKIMKIEQASGNLINVYFTHPVGVNSETSAYYELYRNGTAIASGSAQNLTAKKLQAVNNAVSILLKNSTMTQGEVYSLKVNGKLTSSYGAKLGEGNGEIKEFVASISDVGQLSVSSVYAASANSVCIIFNRDVDTGWAEKFLNYTVYDANKTAIAVTKATTGGNGDAGGRTVMLSLASPLDKTKQYEVRIEYIPDIYKQSAIESKNFPFPGAYPDNTSLALAMVTSEYINSVVLTFNKALDKSSAANVENYSISNMTDGTFSTAPLKAYYSEQNGQYKVKLFLPAKRTFAVNQRYVVYVTGLKEASGVDQPALLHSDFSSAGYNAVKPQMADAVIVSKDSVKISFSLEIALDINNINTSNYTLEYLENGETIKVEPINVTYLDAKTLVLRFDGLDPSKTYQVRFLSINDYSGVYTRTAAEGGNIITVRKGQ